MSENPHAAESEEEALDQLEEARELIESAIRSFEDGQYIEAWKHAQNSKPEAHQAAEWCWLAGNQDGDADE